MNRLDIVGLGKSFATPVLRDVAFSIAPGEVLGLVGENGAGKSTIVNIINGALRPDCGTVRLDGALHQPDNPRSAYRAGVAVNSQELSLIDTLTVAENILLRALPTSFGLIEGHALKARARLLLDEIGLNDVSLDADVATLSLGRRQMLEFAKAVVLPSRLLILDEPTAALTGPQADQLHAIMAERARAGTAVLYISHRLQDVLSVCDRIAVLRDGEMVLVARSADLDVSKIIAAMSGRPPSQPLEARAKVRSPQPVLSVRGVTTKALLLAVDLDLYGGEILGLSGLAGAGRTELIEALYGLAPLTGGTVERHRSGVVARIRSPADAVAQQMGLLTEDRRVSGIFAGRTTGFTMSVAALRLLSRVGFVRRNAEADRVAELATALGIRSAGDNADIAQLSGGNQQKALFARWLMRGVEVLLLDEPTRGVDVGAKADIYHEIRKLASQGCAILIVSSEIEELISLCDRIKVVSGGQLVGEFEPPDFDRGAILTAAFQGHLGARGSSPNSIGV
jgi:ribose transport system ATP-binding protein